MKGFGNRTPETLFLGSPFSSLAPACRTPPATSAYKPERPTNWLDQWCHLVDSVGTAHGDGGKDPSLEEVLLEGWGGASAPAWAGQRLPPLKAGFRTPRTGPKSRPGRNSEFLWTTVVYKAHIRELPVSVLYALFPPWSDGGVV